MKPSTEKTLILFFKFFLSPLWLCLMWNLTVTNIFKLPRISYFDGMALLMIVVILKNYGSEEKS